MQDSSIAAVQFQPAAPAGVILRRDNQTKAAQTARRTAHRLHFADCMELAMTGLMFAGAFLLGAALLHYGVPASAARRIGVFSLYGVAVTIGAQSAFNVVQGLLHLGRSF